MRLSQESQLDRQHYQQWTYTAGNAVCKTDRKQNSTVITRTDEWTYKLMVRLAKVSKQKSISKPVVSQKCPSNCKERTQKGSSILVKHSRVKCVFNARKAVSIQHHLLTCMQWQSRKTANTEMTVTRQLPRSNTHRAAERETVNSRSTQITDRASTTNEWQRWRSCGVDSVKWIPVSSVSTDNHLH